MTSSFDPTAWLEKSRIEKKIQPDTDSSSSDALSLLSSTPLATPVPANDLFSRFEEFFQRLVLEQMERPEELLKLNPSRREDLGQFLTELSKTPSSVDPQEALKSFVRIDRSEAEHEALKQLFKQIAFVQIAKALLLLSWSRRKNQPLKKADLKDITGAIERELRSLIGLQTSTCQLIQRNFYSWYKLDQSSQDALWSLLEEVTDMDAVKDWVLSRAIKLSAETLGERDRYSKSFYQNLWDSIQKYKILELRGKTNLGFSPTLRDGSFMAQAPEQVEWIGFEPISFELLFCEIRHLWESPKSPPLWIKGTSLEMSMEPQSTMLLTASGKQNTVQLMESISNCEVALIAEESLIRTVSRALAAQALRKQVDQHSVLKKMKQPQTTRGMYQACQALEKLRQNGLLIWAREELLNETSGKPTLQHILTQAKILLIADFTALECADESLKKDLPRSLYLLQKENSLEARKSHRPVMIKAYGCLKNPADITMLFDRVFSLVKNPDQVFPLEPFQIHSRISPVDQREWEHHWFNPTDDQLVDQIESLKRSSTPLGQLALIRTIHGSFESAFAASLPSEPSLFHSQGIQDRPERGFYVWTESSKHGNEIFTAEAEHLPDYMKKGHSLYWVSPYKAEWIEPLQVLIRSQLIRDWLNYSIESKKGAWIMKESDFKVIPVPKHISKVLMETEPSHHAFYSVLQVIPIEPGQALRTIESFTDASEQTRSDLHGHVFATAARVFQGFEIQQKTLFSLFSPDEQLIYTRFFKTMLPDHDCVGLGKHPFIRFTPTLSPRMPIHQITMVKVPAPGILLSTNKGINQQLFIQDSWLRERCFELIQEVMTKVADPTWEELCDQVRLPKNPDQVQQLAQQIFKAYHSEKMKRKELNHLIGVCLLNPSTQSSKIGLLQ